MKRTLPFLLLGLLCLQPAFAFQHYVGQFYDGEARPRTEVSWIWVGTSSDGFLGEVSFDGIDHSKISTSHNYNLWKVLEVLPGKHVVSVSYEDASGRSEKDQEFEIDAKAGENYVIVGKTEFHWKGANKWSSTIATFTPEVKDVEKLKREKLEPSTSVDGVVQSWKHARLVLAIPENAQVREFKVDYDLRVGQIIQPAGRKVRVFYFPSRPEEAVTVNVIE
jgi:hypothetical protein